MKTLYDLIGALPEDDADELRAAFRRAVKEKHPDLNPDDPEASLEFRRIVRANAILSDPRQREAYDQLLDNARRQEQPKPTRGGIAAGIRRFGVDAMVSVVASVVVIGGYFLLRPAEPFAPLPKTEMTRFVPPPTVTVSSTDLSARERAGLPDGSESIRPEAVATELPGVGQAADDAKHAAAPPDNNQPIEVASVGPQVAIGSAAATGNAAAPEHTASEPEAAVEPESGARDVYYYRQRGISAYRKGDFTIALANFDLAIKQDPACADCYVDRGIVLHRMGDFKSAFHDVAEARRIDLLKRMDVPLDVRAH